MWSYHEIAEKMTPQRSAWLRRIAWFAALWAGGVLAVAALGGLIRMMLSI